MVAIPRYFFYESMSEEDKKPVQDVYDQVVSGRRPGVCLHFADTIDNAQTREYVCLRVCACVQTCIIYIYTYMNACIRTMAINQRRRHQSLIPRVLPPHLPINLLKPLAVSCLPHPFTRRVLSLQGPPHCRTRLSRRHRRREVKKQNISYFMYARYCLFLARRLNNSVRQNCFNKMGRAKYKKKKFKV